MSLARGVERAPDFPDPVWDVDADTTPFAPITLREDVDGAGMWAECRIQRSAWSLATLRSFDGIWVVERPLSSLGVPGDRIHQELRSGDREFRFLDSGLGKTELPRGTFIGVRSSLYLLLEPGEEPPAETTYSVYLYRGQPLEGAWQLSVGNYSGPGLSVWPGQELELEHDVPEDSVLLFATAGMIHLEADTEPVGDVVFRVSLEDSVLFEERRGPEELAHAVHHVVELPRERRAGARLKFEVEGRAAVTAFIDPRLAPREASPTGRPDLAIFLADTFRADNMRTYGSPVEITPALDAFAAESLVFERAWSPASWTLPSHASLMTALYPYQHGVVTRWSLLSQGAATLAERLSDAGYRTGAVTDSRYVSARFGLAQGFQWFDEAERDLADTLRGVRSFLDSGDGRPTFLFVHTFHVHEPYEVTDETRRELADRLEIPTGEHMEIADAARGAAARTPGEPSAIGELPEVRRFHDLYRGGVGDLDRGFAELLADLEERRYFDNGYLFFTSDHGEAFGEHGVIGHGNGVFEENVRIPLLLRGPGIEPRLDSRPASLVDLPRTVAELLDVGAHADWGGRSLLGADEDPGPVYAFICRPKPGDLENAKDGVARLEMARKTVAGMESGSLDLVPGYGEFDLARDPGETTESAPGAEDSSRFAEGVRELMQPVYSAGTATLTREHLQGLAAAGYLGDDEEP